MVPPGLSVGWLLILAAGVPLVASLETVRRLSSLEKAVVDMRSEMRRFGATAERLASSGERLLARIDTREPAGTAEDRPVRRNPRWQGAESLENRLGDRAVSDGGWLRCTRPGKVRASARAGRNCSLGQGRGVLSLGELVGGWGSVVGVPRDVSGRLGVFRVSSVVLLGTFRGLSEPLCDCCAKIGAIRLLRWEIPGRNTSVLL